MADLDVEVGFGSGDGSGRSATTQVSEHVLEVHDEANDFLQKALNPEFFSREEIRGELTRLDYTPCVTRALPPFPARV